MPEENRQTDGRHSYRVCCHPVENAIHSGHRAILGLDKAATLSQWVDVAANIVTHSSPEIHSAFTCNDCMHSCVLLVANISRWPTLPPRYGCLFRREMHFGSSRWNNDCPVMQKTAEALLLSIECWDSQLPHNTKNANNSASSYDVIGANRKCCVFYTHCIVKLTSLAVTSKVMLEPYFPLSNLKVNAMHTWHTRCHHKG
jgi:hypothetical protein